MKRLRDNVRFRIILRLVFKGFILNRDRRKLAYFLAIHREQGWPAQHGHNRDAGSD
jgi:hypothetical protein